MVFLPNLCVMLKKECSEYSHMSVLVCIAFLDLERGKRACEPPKSSFLDRH